MSRLRKATAAAVAAVALAALITAGNAALAPPARADIAARGPSAGADDNGNQFVFWRGTGGQLEEAWWSSYTRTWSGPINLVTWSGTMGSEPSVAVSVVHSPCNNGHNACGQQYVYWKGTDGGLWMADYAGNPASWHGPINLGMGTLGSQPTASFNSYVPTSPTGWELAVYWKGTDGNVWYAYSQSGFTAKSDYSGPHAASYNGAGLGPLGSSPSASATAKFCLEDVCASADYVVWQGTDGELWDAVYNLNTNAWNTPAMRAPCGTGTCGQLGGPPSITANQSSFTDTVWQGAGGSYNLWWTENGSYAIDEAMGTLGSAPTIAWQSGTGATDWRLYVFWKGSSDASLYEAYYDRATYTWHGPIYLGMGPLG